MKCKKIASRTNINITSVENSTLQYMEAIKINSIDFSMLFIATVLVLFMYTFLRIKVNAVKKIVGYSPIRIISDSFKEVFKIQVLSISLIIMVHGVYYLLKGVFIFEYIVGLCLILIVRNMMNMAILFLTAMTIPYINIQEMLKFFSHRLLVVLHIIKISLILAMTTKKDMKLH